MLNKYFFKKTNIGLTWSILLPTLCLVVISLVTLYGTKGELLLIESNFFKQMIFFIIGIIIFYLTQLVRITFFYEMAYFLYVILFFLLIATFFMPEKFGATRWIFIGSFRFQPSEFGKIIIVFALSKYLSDFRGNGRNLKIIPIVMMIVLLPAMLIFKQPDLGTALIFPAITFPMLLWSGVSSFYLFFIVSPLLSILAAFNLQMFYIWIILLTMVVFISRPMIKDGIFLFVINLFAGTLSSFIWNNLYPHQKNRILTLFDPSSDPLGAGYQIIQSITAIGSGGFLGKGYGEGSQTHLRFLPVRDSDFIASVIGEEFGFVGILVIFILFYWMIFSIIERSEKLNNQFGSFVLIGFSSVIFFHFIINMGMVVSLFPVTGLPLPFISYGGTFLLSMLFMVSVINNIINNDIEV